MDIFLLLVGIIIYLLIGLVLGILAIKKESKDSIYYTQDDGVLCLIMMGYFWPLVLLAKGFMKLVDISIRRGRS